VKYHLLCEVGSDGSAQIFVQELPGCYSRAPTLDEATAKAPRKIREFLDWLRRHGEPIDEADFEVEVELSERIDGDWPINLGDSQALFRADLRPLDKEEVERCIRYMRYAREDVINLYLSAPTDAQEWKPDQTTPRHIKRIAEHIAEVDLFYIERLRGRRFRDWPLTFLEVSNELANMRLSNLTNDEMSCAVSYHPPGGWTGTTEAEGWTTRKALRRFIWHDRLHTATIEKLIRLFRVSQKDEP